MFCYSNIVDKELKYNQHIFISLFDSHAIQKNNVVLKKSKFGDTLETVLMASLQSVCESKTQPKVTP